MTYDEENVRSLLTNAVKERGYTPAFYAVTGSHMYGFADETDSDVDVRGFHVADGCRYALLDAPPEQVVVNQGSVTEGFEEYADIDLVSYELRKFGTLLYQANFNVLETVFDGLVVWNDVPDELAALRSLVEAELPLDVPRAYVGMARQNYHSSLNPASDSYDPSAKMYLYVIRGLLAAEYVSDRRQITADVRELSKQVLGETTLVDALIDVKVNDEPVSEDLATRADERITSLLEAANPQTNVDKTDYRAQLDEWMLDVRRRTTNE